MFFLLAWFTNYGVWLISKDLNKYTIISTGILLFIYSLTKIIKPHLFPKAQLIYSSPVTDTFFIWTQRSWGVLLLITSMLMIGNYRPYYYLEVDIFILVVFAAILTMCIIWIIYFLKRQILSARLFVIGSLAMTLILCVPEIRWIKFDLGIRCGHIVDAYKEPIIVKLIVRVIVLIIIFALWNKAHMKEKENKKIINPKALLKIASIAAALIIVWLVLGNLLASRMEKEVEQEWAKNSLPFEYVRRLEPSKNKNESAKKIEELALKLNIYLKQEDWEKHSSDQHRKSIYDELNNELDYFPAQIQKPDNIVDKPSSKLKKYFENHEQHLLAFEDYVLTHEPPVWADWKYCGNQDSCLDATEMMSLQRVLITCTIARISDSKHQEALKMLETAWKLNLYLKNTPDFWAWAASDVHLGWYAGVLRKIENAPPCWRDRLNSDSYEKQLFLTIQKIINYYYDYEKAYKENLDFFSLSGD